MDSTDNVVYEKLFDARQENERIKSAVSRFAMEHFLLQQRQEHSEDTGTACDPAARIICTLSFTTLIAIFTIWPLYIFLTY